MTKKILKKTFIVNDSDIRNCGMRWNRNVYLWVQEIEKAIAS